MSVFDDQNPDCQQDNCPDEISMLVIPRSVDLGGFEVARVLPSEQQRCVGPFVFLDQMGRNVIPEGQGLDVRPHPHIGLSTLTYLFEGEIVHRDTLANTQIITPGDVNLMTAGRGIAHSERTDYQKRDRPNPLFGLQCWSALPQHLEEIEPDFSHTSKDQLPFAQEKHVQFRVVTGHFHGLRSPVATASDTLFVDLKLQPKAQISIPADSEERAIYIISGTVSIGSSHYEPARLLVIKPGHTPTIHTEHGARVVVLGGEILDGHRHIWWNFVSSSKERIFQAQSDWQNGLFGTIPGDREEFIPLPKK